MTQYNGCTCCLSEGKHIGGSRVYLPDDRGSHSDTQDLATKAVCDEIPQKGVKGASSLSKVLNIPHSIPLDYMHCILEGVTKLLIGCWFNRNNHQKTYYLR